jgi:hypothetical protein
VTWVTQICVTLARSRGTLHCLGPSMRELSSNVVGPVIADFLGAPTTANAHGWPASGIVPVTWRMGWPPDGDRR